MFDRWQTLSEVDVENFFLPAVRTGLNHSTTSCLRDCSMLLLAFGRNAK